MGISMDKKALSSRALLSSKEWAVTLDPEKNQLEILNRGTEIFSRAWLVNGQLKMSGLADKYMMPLTDAEELERHRLLASDYTNHLK